VGGGPAPSGAGSEGAAPHHGPRIGFSVPSLRLLGEVGAGAARGRRGRLPRVAWNVPRSFREPRLMCPPSHGVWGRWAGAAGAGSEGAACPAADAPARRRALLCVTPVRYVEGAVGRALEITDACCTCPVCLDAGADGRLRRARSPTRSGGSLLRSNRQLRRALGCGCGDGPRNARSGDGRRGCFVCGVGRWSAVGDHRSRRRAPHVVLVPHRGHGRPW